MRMYEERDWYDCSEMIADLHNKINQYLAFIFSDQISEYKEYIGKPIVFMLYCQYIPPREIYPTLQDLEVQLRMHNIDFEVYIGPDEEQPLNWHVE